MTTPAAQLGFNLGRSLETILATIGGGVVGELVGGPLACFSAIGTGFSIINQRWENAEERAFQKRESNKSDLILENSKKNREITEKTFWLSCRIISYSSIVIGSIISYCNFDINKKFFCNIDTHSFDCSKYFYLNAVSIISAFTFSVIGLFDIKITKQQRQNYECNPFSLFNSSKISTAIRNFRKRI